MVNKKQFTKEALVRLLQKNPGGLRLPEIKSQMKCSETTVLKLLDITIATKEVYRENRGRYFYFATKKKEEHD